MEILYDTAIALEKAAHAVLKVLFARTAGRRLLNLSRKLSAQAPMNM